MTRGGEFLDAAVIRPREHGDVWLRPATIVDAAALRAWRNDPDTTRYSVVSAPVSWIQHSAWVEASLRAPDRRLMVAVDRASCGVIGSCRLDGVGTDLVEVSLTIRPEVRGFGWAAPVIVVASALAVSLGASRLVARVHTENERSRRAFGRAGYVLGGACGRCGEYVFETWDATWETVARVLCSLCRAGAPHHTNAAGSIGGADRHEIYDVHAVEDASGVGLRECDAGDVLLAWERNRPSGGGHSAAGDPRTGNVFMINDMFGEEVA